MFQQMCFLEDHCTKRDELRSFYMFFFFTKTVHSETNLNSFINSFFTLSVLNHRENNS